MAVTYLSLAKAKAKLKKKKQTKKTESCDVWKIFPKRNGELIHSDTSRLCGDCSDSHTNHRLHRLIYNLLMSLPAWHELTAPELQTHSFILQRLHTQKTWPWRQHMTSASWSVSLKEPKWNNTQKKISVQSEAERCSSAGDPVWLSFNSPGGMIKGWALAGSYIASSTHPAADCCSSTPLLWEATARNHAPPDTHP